MGAAYQSRLAGDRERRRLRIVDPELAAIKDQEELEVARQKAAWERKGRGLPQVHPKSIQEQKEREKRQVVQGFWLLFWIAFIILIIVSL
jgi:hypothetical protein